LVLRRPSALLIAILTPALALAALATAIPYAFAQAQPPAPTQSTRTVTGLVGAGQDTLQALNFFPQSIRIRQGDTVFWRMNGEELHTVSFVKGVTQWATGAQQLPIGAPGELNPGFAVAIAGAPPDAFQVNPQLAFPTRPQRGPVESYGGPGVFVSSGLLSKEAMAPDAPANDSFSLRFTTPGTFMYVCLVHNDRMFGWVDVAASNATDVPSQAQIDQQANLEIQQMTNLLQAAKAQGDATARSEAGPNGTRVWFARAGTQELFSGDSRAQVMEFLPRNVTVKPGDTVVWGTNYFHTVSFVPSPPAPEWVEAVMGPNGTPMLAIRPNVFLPVKPAGTYDPTQYFNSGIIGPFTPAGETWALTFDQPGTYEYVCLVHDDMGMKGTITVQP